jgi:GDPmannose 4,6-dehydratase
MWLILQHKIPDDFILATGKSITVREFANKVFKKLNLDLIWTGKKENEKGLCKKTGKILIGIDKNYYRPNEVNFLLGNAKKAKKILKWRPLIKLDKMIDDMINFKLND